MYRVVCVDSGLVYYVKKKNAVSDLRRKNKTERNLFMHTHTHKHSSLYYTPYH